MTNFLYDESEVERRQQALHDQVMHFHRDELANEASKRSARQGGQLVYGPDGEHSWWLDHARSALYGPADGEREQRLRDHRNQALYHREYRTGLNTSVGTGGAATMPYWDTDHFVIGAHALAPLAGLATNVPLPPHGNSVVLPQITSGVTAAVQYPQNTSVTDGSVTYVDAAQTCPKSTLMAPITLGRQLIDQGFPGYGRVLARELGAAIGAVKETQLISGSGSSGQVAGIESQAGVQTISATGSVAGIYNALSQAISLISTSRLRMPDFVAGSPELFAYLAASIGTTGNPFMPPRPYEMLNGVAPENIPAELMGMKFVADPQVAASLGAQYMIVGVSSDLILWEGPIDVVFHRQTLANQLSVLCVATQEIAFGLQYPTGVVIVGPISIPGLSGS
jgi:HK97 family phage major capsid protein